MSKKTDKNTNKKQRERKFLKWFWGILLIPVVVFVLMILLTSWGAFGKLPSFEELENPKSNLATELYSDDGTLIGSFYIQNRSYVEYDELSPALVAALVSTEDSRFYSHSGIDFVSLARVGFKTVLMGKREQGGGSTITQQLAKNLFPRDTVTRRNPVSRSSKMVVTKLKEWITAVKLEYNYTKEEIITMYLNTVFYGSNAYGIKSAASTFFDKTPAELNTVEAAVLVGVVNAPTRFSPLRNPARSTERRNVVLTRMYQNNYITQEQCDSLVQLPLVINYTPVSHNDGVAAYFREMIRNVMNAPRPTRKQYNTKWDYEQELKIWESNPIYGWCHKNKKADGTPYNIYRDGLKIYTTINYKMQEYAEASLQRQLERTIQPAMDAQWKKSGELFIDTSQEDIEKIIFRSMRYTDRYINLLNKGASKADIDKEFRTPVKMKIFTYKGEADTVMTPRDSILHHKRMMRGAMMSMDPTSGQVKTYVGGPNFRYFKYDMVKQGKRQVGSTIKPFVYTFAIDHMGFTPCTMVPNLPVTIETQTGKPWTPKEAGNVIYDGTLHPLRWGMAKSRNNYSAWIMKQAKQPRAVADFIHNMGIHSYIDPVDALCLGPADVSLYEMVGAYSTFANQGVFTEPIFVTRIEDRQGNLISTFVPTSSDAISEETAYTMLEMLKNVVRDGTAGRLRWQYGFLDADMGAKTGTSQENRDAWFMAVTPKLVTGVWIGGDDQSVHLTGRAEGSAIALPIFGEFMKKVYADPSLGIRQADRFVRPAGAVTYDCEDSVILPSSERYSVGDEFFD